jgi:hypothetical protein
MEGLDASAPANKGVELCNVRSSPCEASLAAEAKTNKRHDQGEQVPVGKPV